MTQRIGILPHEQAGVIFPAAGFRGAGQDYVRFLAANPAAEVEAAAKKLREQPHDKQALEDLERAVQRFKESAPTPAPPAPPAA